MVCRRYRPRQPRASPVWQVSELHWPAFSVAGSQAEPADDYVQPDAPGSFGA
jgi:hypothetical protein